MECEKEVCVECIDILITASVGENIQCKWSRELNRICG